MKKTVIPLSPVALALTILFAGILISIAVISGVRGINIGYKVECDPATPLSRDCFIKYAQVLGLNSREFVNCVDSRSTKGSVDKASELAESLSLPGTPTYYIGKNSGDVFKGYSVSWLDDEQMDVFINYLKDNSFEEVNAWLKVEQGKAVEKFKEQVLAYLQSEEGGSLSGQELEQGLAEYIPTQEILDQGIALVDISLEDTEKEGSGPVYLYLFSDYECPACRQFFESGLQEYREKYIETGIMTLVFQDFPLDSLHPNARGAAEAARCAGNQGRYFDFHDILFKSQGGS